MKTRTGFVSNSSSSSFIIAISDLTIEQLHKIENHIETAKEMPHDLGCLDCPWDIERFPEYIKGRTGMDNFDMHMLMKVIGVDMEKVDWEHS